MVKIGDLRERVALQQEASVVADGGGGYDFTWQTVATVWARVRPLSGRELAARGGMESPVNYEVTLRRRTDAALTTGWRLLWGTIPLNIRSVRNMDERGEFLTLDCESGVAT